MEVHPTGSEGRRMDGCSTLIIGNNIYCNLIQQYRQTQGQKKESLGNLIKAGI